MDMGELLASESDNSGTPFLLRDGGSSRPIVAYMVA